MKTIGTALGVGIVLAALFIGGAYFAGGLPIVELEPDGSCRRVIALEGGRGAGKDCGWEIGRRYQFRYVAPDPARPPGGKG